MKRKSIGRTSASIKREIAALKKMPDSQVDFSDIPLQDANDLKWKNAVIGRFYRPIKKPIALRLDTDVIAWLKAKGPGYQSRINEILRERMAAERKHA
ncbi:MAG: BrnA antitoxin family protein [Bryobacteraceae bacterium]